MMPECVRSELALSHRSGAAIYQIINMPLFSQITIDIHPQGLRHAKRLTGRKPSSSSTRCCRIANPIRFGLGKANLRRKITKQHTAVSISPVRSKPKFVGARRYWSVRVSPVVGHIRATHELEAHPKLQRMNRRVPIWSTEKSYCVRKTAISLRYSGDMSKESRNIGMPSRTKVAPHEKERTSTCVIKGNRIDSGQF